MRKKRAEVRDVLPDPVYNSKIVTKLVNQIMTRGKKGTAQKILYDAFKVIEKETNRSPLDVYNEALENIKPALEVKSRRVGASNYQVPVEVREERSASLALRWLVNYAKLRNGKSMSEKLANEIMDAAKGVGGAAKKREDTHKMAEANKAFAHYRW
jgi:small subunit ribosomal protein S7